MIYIIGYMASGKTTFGKALAETVGVPFIDLDHYIEEREGTTIRRIFESQGEEEFRRIEREALHETSSMTDAIISCGGGTPCYFDNIDFMRKHGTVIWLQASGECLLRRLAVSRDKRPLTAGKSDDEIREMIATQLQKRRPYYSQAHHIWDGDTLEDLDQITANITRFLHTHPTLLPPKPIPPSSGSNPNIPA